MIKLLTYNILEGGLPNRLPRILRAIASAQADVVAVQEARHWRRRRRAAFRRAAHALRMSGILVPANSGFDFAVFSRLPIVRWENLGRDTIFVHTTAAVDLLAPSGQPFTVVVTHLSPEHARRQREAKLLLRWLRPLQRSFCALCGDLNTLSPGDHYARHLIWPDSPLTKRPLQVIPSLERAGWEDCFRLRNPRAPGLTLGQGRRAARVDYIFASKPLAGRLAACRVLRHPEVRTASDHSPVWAAFDI